jgi:hypothetical protein
MKRPVGIILCLHHVRERHIQAALQKKTAETAMPSRRSNREDVRLIKL